MHVTINDAGLKINDAVIMNILTLDRFAVLQFLWTLFFWEARFWWEISSWAIVFMKTWTNSCKIIILYEIECEIASQAKFDNDFHKSKEDHGCKIMQSQ